MGIVGFNFYHDEPLFGLDIGNSSLKVMQFDVEKRKSPQVIGYGMSSLYPSDCISEGVVVNPKVLGDALYDVLKNRLVGTIDTRRVACTIPSSHIFSRPMKLPVMDKDELTEAVHLEVEQYIPVPIDNLYLDYEVTRRSNKEIELSTVAIPKKIVDSYTAFLETVGLEPVALEPTMNALARLFSAADPSNDSASILLDYGSLATDLAVYDRTMLVNSTVPVGIDQVVEAISKKLNVSPEQARKLKNTEGINNPHSAVSEVVKPALDNLVKEIQKIIRYHNDRNAPAHRAISQLILAGGGSTMPGLSQYLSKALGMPARMLDPWVGLDFGHLPQPSEFDRSLYLTVAGEAALHPREILA
ncbi:hypothetical protein A3A68_02375 [Candidatus Saccharibacteria bacterium RIFCSPLOWO2_01_FULL_48_13]|nr:MAG: hypothetical protein A2884_00115 [Candidatus Saccharibacteria bacterium RIFCSPHIGHO2_01_FULL_48_12]OGL36074.1 MAG: hypothetical protein A3F38_00520 [Candidatus Saccharibacteria bacterium RIFCSPHIGHO2_12_FULL_48_21]OGL36767.1 MAG: hypothetical protein A3A68_02375 [Candidatus Saccharibacteria bacterium RIFCSPLOWO2_01_FULL_48_13]